MVQHREEKEVWKWVRVWHSQTQRAGFARKCSVWKWRGVSVTAVVYVHDRFTVKALSVDVAAAVWLSVVLNECGRDNEITVVIHKSKRKVAVMWTQGLKKIGWRSLWILNNMNISEEFKTILSKNINFWFAPKLHNSQFVTQLSLSPS